MSFARCLFLIVLLLVGVTRVASAEPDGDEVAAHHEDRGFKINLGSSEVKGDGGILILFGAFCALWAQNTGRSAWLWFFLGVFFSVVAVIVLLVKNSDDRFDLKQYGRTSRGRRPDTYP